MLRKWERDLTNQMTFQREGGHQGESQSFQGESARHFPGGRTHLFLVFFVQGQARTTVLPEPTGLFSLRRIEAEEARDAYVIGAAVGRQRDQKQTRNLGIQSLEEFGKNLAQCLPYTDLEGWALERMWLR